MKHLVLFDIDHTLGTFQGGGSDRIVEMAARHSWLSVVVCRELLTEQIESTEGFSFESYVRTLSQQARIESIAKLREELEHFFEESFQLYPDAQVCLTALRQEKAITCGIVSQGNRDFQMKKVTKLGLDFDRAYIEIIPYTTSKAESIQTLSQRAAFDRIWFVDDKLSVVNDVRSKLWERVRVIHIDRTEIPDTLPIDTTDCLEDFANMILFHAW